MIHPTVVSMVAAIRRRANEYMLRQLADQGLEGLGPSHAGILGRLFQHGDMAMAQIAAAIRRDKSTVTTLVRKLEAMGYVARRKAPDDARKSLISLTPKGRALRPSYERIIRELTDLALTGLDAEERRTLMALLQRVRNNLSQPR
jgi:DNA-binding MarR family transcriptional regulator